MKSFIRKRLREQMIDGQNMNSGMQKACNTMSVATYKEGLNLIINAIGTPQDNPEMWKKIDKPLKNWQEADLMIGQEVKEKGMSGDSMVDESNTWWSAIQSTICELGGDGLNESVSREEWNALLKNNTNQNTGNFSYTLKDGTSLEASFTDLKIILSKPKFKTGLEYAYKIENFSPKSIFDNTKAFNSFNERLKELIYGNKKFELSPNKETLIEI